MSDATLPDYEKLGVFYLGRKYDLATKKTLNDLILFPSKNLVTHGLVVGMTGSGKTGLCFDLIEEAAMDGIPAIVIDPKGDLTNLMLSFPELRPEDFKPWVNAEDAAKAGVDVDQFAAQQADIWKKGLADWQQDSTRIKRLRDKAEFSIYTPGSSAGIQVSVLKSFARPAPEIMEDNELLRERLGSTVAGLLQLVGIEADPVKSRETVFLAHILQNAWANGTDLDLAGLISEVQEPKVKKIGVLDVDSFFPAKDRFELAMQLNNLLASPNFSAWLQGESLEVGNLLHTAAGKPRVAIFSISHLSDAERMFFVTMLLNQVLGWMRTQSGTSSLRALLYMDEIFGYFPPVKMPPSKQPLLTLLKQARAFGLGVVLATQNPVDLDYKGLANIGTWFIGRLQTERDKLRILDGLEGAAADQGSGFHRQEMEKTLSALGNRVFLLHSVHEDHQELMQSRWAMSYLRGPMSRAQIKEVMASKKDAPSEASKDKPKSAVETKQPKAVAASNVTSQRPMLSPDVPQYFLTPNKPGSIEYQPRLLGLAQVRFTDKKLKVDEGRNVCMLTAISDDAVPVDWEQAQELNVTPDDLSKEASEGSFASVAAAAGQAKNYSKWSKDFASWIYANFRLSLFQFEHDDISQTSTPEQSKGAFLVTVKELLREKRDEAQEKVRRKYEKQIATRQEKIRKCQQKVEAKSSQSTTSKVGSALSVGATIFGWFTSRKVTATNINKTISAAKTVGRTMQSGETVEAAQKDLKSAEAELESLNEQMTQELNDVAEKFGIDDIDLQTLELKPTKTNISIRVVGLLWVPYVKDNLGVLTEAFESKSQQ